MEAGVLGFLWFVPPQRPGSESRLYNGSGVRAMAALAFVYHELRGLAQGWTRVQCDIIQPQTSRTPAYSSPPGG